MKVVLFLRDGGAKTPCKRGSIPRLLQVAFSPVKVALFLREGGPKTPCKRPPPSGIYINITNDSVSSSAKKQYHHFFPIKSKAITTKQEYSATANNVVNIVFMDAITNDQISNRNPSEYIAEFEKTNTKIADALESHFISRRGYGIDKDDYFVFLKARSRAFYDKLCQLIIPAKGDTITNAEPDL